MTGPLAVGIVATAVGAVPLAWLGDRVRDGGSPDASYWWLAIAFAISVVSDTASLFERVDRTLASLVYPVAQSGLIGAALLLRRSTAILFVAALAAGAALAVSTWTPGRYDLAFRAVAWACLCGIAWHIPRFRASLLVYFGLGIIAWAALLASSGWPTYLAYQGTRVLGIVLFCAATRSSVPTLRLTRPIA